MILQQKWRRMRTTRGVSTVLTTVVLTGVMLTMIGVAIFYASSLVEMRRQQMEYENAKNLVLYLRDALEQVALGSGGAKYVRFSLISSKINFLKDSYCNVTVQVNGETLISDKADAVVMEGGSLVSVVAFSMLSPAIDDLQEALTEYRRVIVDAGEPLCIVYENQSLGAKVFLACKRVRVNYVGLQTMMRGGVQHRYAWYEVSYIRLNITTFGGVGNVALVARNMEVEIMDKAYLFTPYLNITASCGAYRDTYVENLPEGADGFLVVIRIADINIGTLG